MRGDSLRDLYAKTIAVFGLGLLAGAGALVDYWPTGVAMPFVRSAFPEVAIAGALPVPKTLPAIETLPAGRTREVASPRHVSPLPTLAATGTVDIEFGPTLVLAAPPPRFNPTAALLTDGQEVALTAPEPVTTMALYTAPVSGSDDGNGFISTAFKKTGSSIASAGSKTGASIVGAWRTVTGVMRRVNPFN